MYTQDELDALSRVGITLQDALNLGIQVRDADDIQREVLEDRAFSGFPALSLEEEEILFELRLERMTERLSGVDLFRDERTHRDSHYDGGDDTPLKGEFLRDGDKIVLTTNFEVRKSRDGRKMFLVGAYSTIMVGIGKNGKPYAMTMVNRF